MSYASDLPAVHRSPAAMARCLVGYIPCDKRVLSEIRANFETSQLCLGDIQAIRARRERQSPAGEPVHTGDFYDATKASGSMNPANAAFVARLLTEKRTLRLRKVAA